MLVQDAVADVPIAAAGLHVDATVNPVVKVGQVTATSGVIVPFYGCPGVGQPCVQGSVIVSSRHVRGFGICGCEAQTLNGEGLLGAEGDGERHFLTVADDSQRDVVSGGVLPDARDQII